MRKIMQVTPFSLVLISAILLIFVAPAPTHSQTGGVLFVTDNRVGIGTDAPVSPLEIQVATGFAALRLDNQEARKQWSFVVTPTGSFSVNRIGSGGQEFTVRDRLDAGGFSTMEVQGSIDATAFNVTSSRELKTDFKPVDSVEVLERLLSMPVTEWSFKDDETSKRHLGPVAEEFRDAFNLGDGRTISLADATGVTIAAIQGIHTALVDREAEVEQLKERIAKLEDLVRALAPEQEE